MLLVDDNVSNREVETFETMSPHEYKFTHIILFLGKEKRKRKNPVSQALQQQQQQIILMEKLIQMSLPPPRKTISMRLLAALLSSLKTYLN